MVLVLVLFSLPLSATRPADAYMWDASVIVWIIVTAWFPARGCLALRSVASPQKQKVHTHTHTTARGTAEDKYPQVKSSRMQFFGGAKCSTSRSHHGLPFFSARDFLRLFDRVDASKRRAYSFTVLDINWRYWTTLCSQCDKGQWRIHRELECDHNAEVLAPTRTACGLNSIRAMRNGWCRKCICPSAPSPVMMCI